MLGDDSELNEKFKEFELKLEQLKNEISEASEQDIVADVEQGFTDVGSGGSEQLFKIHWVEVSETSFEKCEDVKTTEDAQKAFKEAAIERGVGMRSEEVLHGDLMVLLCNSAKEEDEKSDEVTYNDACYFIGMCINTDNTWHQDENPQGDIKIGESQTASGDSTIRQFIAWNSCGTENCPEDPDAIQIDELVPPESEGGDEEIKGIEMKSSFGDTIKAKVHELQSMTFTKKDPDASDGDGDGEDPIEYVMFKDGIEYDAGALFKFSNYINEATDGYDVKANVNQVSLSSSSATIEEVKYKTKAYELQKISLMADSCGALKRERAKDDNGDDIEAEKINLLTKLDESGSQHTISSLGVIEGSEEVSLGSLDLQSLLVTNEPFISGNNPPDFFVPAIIDANGSDGVVNGIEEKKEVKLLNDFTIEITKTSIGSDDDNCTKVTLTPKFKKQDFTFHSGLLTKVADPGEWQAGTAVSFNVMECAKCDGTLSAVAPNVIISLPGSTLTALPVDEGREFPDCAPTYSVIVRIDEDPDDDKYRYWQLNVSLKNQDGNGGYKNTAHYREVNVAGAGNVSSDVRIDFEKVYTPDEDEPVGEIWQSGKGTYSPTYSLKIVDGQPTETDFYTADIEIT